MSLLALHKRSGNLVRKYDPPQYYGAPKTVVEDLKTEKIPAKEGHVEKYRMSHKQGRSKFPLAIFDNKTQAIKSLVRFEGGTRPEKVVRELFEFIPCEEV